jgi:uncharacterized protein (DUF983 family)
MELPWAALVQAAVTLKCPACRDAAIFDGLLKLKSVCQCGFDFSASDNGDGPAVFLIFIIGFLFLPLVVYVEFHADRPGWLSLLIWTPPIIGLTLLLLRPTKALSVALSFHTRRNRKDGQG